MANNIEFRELGVSLFTCREDEQFMLSEHTTEGSIIVYFLAAWYFFLLGFFQKSGKKASTRPDKQVTTLTRHKP